MSETGANPRNQAFLERLEKCRENLGLSERALSIAVTGKPDLIRDMKRRGHLPDGAKLARMAEILSVTTDYLLGTTTTPEQVESDVAILERAVPLTRSDLTQSQAPGIPLVGTGDCADLEFESEGGALVDIERSSFDPEHTVRMITRPPALTGSPDVYAIYYQGESMVPRFEPGEIGICDPTRPPRPGDYVLVQLNDGENNEVTSVLAKRLVSANSREIWLEQFNPPTKFKVPRKRVARLHRIMQQTDLLFG